MDQEFFQVLLARVKTAERQEMPSVKTGLVVQGGGMRGVYSMGALMGLEECGLTTAFDHVFGASAGVINGSYFVAGQAKMAVTVYLDDLSNREFVNFWRPSKIVDIDFLVDEVLSKKKRLDLERVRAARTTIHAVLTDYRTGNVSVVTNHDDSSGWMDVMRATSAMPILYNRVVRLKSGEFIDGGLNDPVPVFRAMETGCTHVLVVVTRPPGFRSDPGFFFKMIQWPFLTSFPKPTRHLILSPKTLQNRAFEFIERGCERRSHVQILTVFPSDPQTMVSRTTTDRKKLPACALKGRNDVRQALGLEPRSDNPFG